MNMEDIAVKHEVDIADFSQGVDAAQEIENLDMKQDVTENKTVEAFFSRTSGVKCEFNEELANYLPFPIPVAIHCARDYDAVELGDGQGNSSTLDNQVGRVTSSPSQSDPDLYHLLTGSHNSPPTEMCDVKSLADEFNTTDSEHIYPVAVKKCAEDSNAIGSAAISPHVDCNTKVEDSNGKVDNSRVKVEDYHANLEYSNKKAGDSNGTVEDSIIKEEDSNAKVEDSKGKVEDSITDVEDFLTKLEDSNAKVEDSNGKVEDPNTKVKDSAKCESSMIVKDQSRPIFEQRSDYSAAFLSHIVTGQHEAEYYKRHYTSDYKPFMCDACDYSSVNASDVIKHRLTHTGERPHTCEVCGYTTTQSSRLTIHRRRHTGERPYKCDAPACDFSTTRAALLTQHKRKHSDERPYKCDACDFSCKQPAQLSVHKLIHTDRKPHKCDVCNFSTRQANNLVRHKRQHTGEMPYKCDKCTYSAKQLSNLLLHKRKQH